MQGRRNDLDPYHNAVDYEQGASSDNMDTNQSASWSDLNVQSSSHPDLISYAGANQDIRMFRGQCFGESCSSSNSKNIVDEDGSKMEQGWPYSITAAPGCSSRSEDVDFEKSRRGFPGTSTAGHNVCSNSSQHPLMRYARSTSTAQCADRIPGCEENNHKHWQALRENVFSKLFDEYSGTQTDRMSLTDCGHYGSSARSSSYSVEEMDGSGSSVGSWNHSSKRKLHEGTSSQSHQNGNSGSFTQNPNYLSSGGPCDNTFTATGFPLSPWPRSNGSATRLNQVDPAQSDAHLPFYAAEGAEYSPSNFDRAGNFRNPQDFVSVDSSFDGNAMRPNVRVFEPASQPQSYIGSLGVRSDAMFRPQSRSLRNESDDMYISLSSSGGHTFRQSEGSVSRSGNSSTLMNFGPNRNHASQDENCAFVSSTEPRNLGQDPTHWSLATGRDNPVMFSSTSRSRTASNSLPFSPPPWIRNQNPASQIHPRFVEVAPWTLFPSYDADLRNQSSRSPPLPSLSSSSTPEVVTISPRPSSHNEQQVHRRLGPLAEAVARFSRPSRERAADIEGRRVLFSEICQALGGARRGDNLRIEDYMLFDPFIHHGLAEMHDRHRDMRLDVDNMSYEELLELEERMGDVNTGLTEEVIGKSMKQHKHLPLVTMTSPDVEPCCVCQEEFEDGEDLGKLDCGHDFHVHCIKQWLMLKNLCPICKTAGLAT
uniref:RING-type E3 ubiquitin transferase n=1 Tax=Kalanchoe fedtschenkoi TaxID=63787 RepID=A0A7N0ZQY1_KALFE